MELKNNNMQVDPIHRDVEETLGPVAKAILNYVQVHVEAADSANGIRDWWLDREVLGPLALSDVDAALESLVAAGWLRRTPAADGIAIYSNALHVRPSIHLILN